MFEPHVHGSHPEITSRLRRAHGHLRSVIEMIEAGRSCVDVAQQLYAVEKAGSQAKRTLIQDHMNHCLESAADAHGHGQRGALEEFKLITKYL